LAKFANCRSQAGLLPIPTAATICLIKRGGAMFAHILIVIIVAIAITAFAERRNIQPALLVAVVGLVTSFIPGMPRLELEPGIILGIVLPPMLFSARATFPSPALPDASAPSSIWVSSWCLPPRPSSDWWRRWPYRA
jgi:hypothetical protein